MNEIFTEIRLKKSILPIKSSHQANGDMALRFLLLQIVKRAKPRIAARQQPVFNARFTKGNVLHFLRKSKEKNWQLKTVANEKGHYYNGKGDAMSKKEKLLDKLLSNSKSFTFDDAETLLGYYGYKKNNKGKTSGSKVMFENEEKNARLLLHRPHPRKELKEYQLKQIIEHLVQEGLL